MGRRQNSFSFEFHRDHPFLPWLILLLLVVLLGLLMMVAYWQVSGVGPQVQVPMFYDAHYLYPRPWTQEQAAPGIPAISTVALYGKNKVSQSFVASADQLAMVSFWLAGARDHPVEVQLEDENGLLGQAAIDLSEAEEGQEYAITFPPIAGSKGRDYKVTLASPSATPQRPLLVASVGGDRLGDALRLNEFTRPGNLVIKSYARGLPGTWWVDAISEQLLPSVFRLRLQQYRPPIFKGAAFAWLLLTTAVASAALLVLASPRKQEMTSNRSSVARTAGWFAVTVLAIFLVWQFATGRARLLPSFRDLQPPQHGSTLAMLQAGEARLVMDMANELWTARREPEPRFFKRDILAGYPAIRVPAESRMGYALTVLPESVFRFGYTAEGSGSIRFSLALNDDVLFEDTVDRSEGGEAPQILWQEVDLARWAGQEAVLTLRTASASEEAHGIWLMPQVYARPTWLLDQAPDNLQRSGETFIFGDTAELLGILVPEKAPLPGEELAVRLAWRPLRPTDRYGKVFVHLLDGDGNVVAQHDSQPLNGAYPTVDWRPGTIIVDEHKLRWPDAPGTGAYSVAVGIYDPGSLQRWTLTDGDGKTVEQNQAVTRLPLSPQP